MSEKLILEKKSANLIPRLSASILQNFMLLKVTLCDGQSYIRPFLNTNDVDPKFV